MDSKEINNNSVDLYEHLTDAERARIESILNEMALHNGSSKSYDTMLYQYYEEIPVSIDEFITNDEYLGQSTDNGNGIYDYWKQALKAIFHEKQQYSEVIFSGAIGQGKTTIGVVIGCYVLYKLLCLREPKKYYRLLPDSQIAFAFLNIYKYLSADVIFTKFQNFLQKSPWFLKHGKLFGRTNLIYHPDKGISFVNGSKPSDIVGRDVFFAIMDEVNDAKKPSEDMQKSGIWDLYGHIKSRMTSRFMNDGILHAKLIMISSKKSDMDFLDQYAQKAKKDPLSIVFDESQWNVLPREKFMINNKWETFKIAVGCRTKRSAILEEDDSRTDQELFDEGFTQIIYPPISLKSQFEIDLDKALRDLAGVSTNVLAKFIQGDKLELCYTTTMENPFGNPEPILGCNNLDIHLWDYYDLSKVPDWIKSLPLFIHNDIAYTGDGYGIACVAAAGMKKIFDTKIQNFRTEPVYIQVFGARIKAEKGDRVNLDKVEQFIFWLKFDQGYNIQMVSADGFASEHLRQQMQIRGINNKLLSLDRTPDGYMSFRNAIYAKRISLLNIPIQHRELLDLEKNEMTGKIDHPNKTMDGTNEIGGGKEIPGSKDLSDAVCGSFVLASTCKDMIGSMTDEVLDFITTEENDRVKFTNDLKDIIIKESLESKKEKNEEEDTAIVENEDSIDQIISKVTARRSEQSLKPHSQEEELEEQFMSSRLAQDGLFIF